MGRISNLFTSFVMHSTGVDVVLLRSLKYSVLFSLDVGFVTVTLTVPTPDVDVDVVITLPTGGESSTASSVSLSYSTASYVYVLF